MHQSVSDDIINDWKQATLLVILRQYSSFDVFNLDETGLFWKVTPQCTLAFKKLILVQEENAPKTVYIVVFVGANMVGEKLPLLGV